MNKKLQDFALVAEIVSAVAIVLSLIYLGLGVREGSNQTELNTQAIQLSVYQNSIAQITQLNLIGIQNPEILGVLDFLRDHDISEIADSLDATKVVSYLFLLFRHGDMLFHEYEQGVLSEGRLRSAMAPLRARLCYQGVASFWEVSRQNFVPEYVAHIDGTIERTCNP